jgi:hypothetical protein
MTIISPAPAVSLETILNGSWKLLRRNWTIALPMVLAFVAIVVACAILVATAIAAGAFAGVARGGRPSDAAVTVIALAYLVLVAVGIVAMIAAATATYGMADAAWERGTATLADGAAAIAARGGQAFVACIGFVGLWVATLILTIPTLGLALLAFPVVTMYVLPAIVSGGRGGFAAFGESWRLVRRYFGTSALATLILIAIQYLVTMVLYVGIIPLEIAVGATGGAHATPAASLLVVFGVLAIVVSLIAVVLLLAYHAFNTLAVVGLYRWLRARAEVEDAQSIPAPIPVSPA